MSALPNCGKLEIRNSPIEGFGVFATADIAKGEILEEIPFVLFPRYTTLGKAVFDMLNTAGFLNPKEKFGESLRMNLKFKDPEKYYFKWFPTMGVDGDPLAYVVLPLGFGPIYNTSNTENNAGWQVKEKTFIFRAERDIKKDEEIKTFYGYFVTPEGAIFNCDAVFNLALDYVDSRVKLKMTRFGSTEQFEAARQSPSIAKLMQLLDQSKSYLTITRISALMPSGEEKVGFDVTSDISIGALYSKLAEAKMSPFPLIKISVEYEDKNSGQLVKESVLFKK